MTVMTKLSLLKNIKRKKSLTLIGSTLAALTLSAVVAAHPGNRDEDHHRYSSDPEHRQEMMEKHSERRLKKMARHLELTDEQTAQLKTLFEQHPSDRTEGASPKALHQAMRNLDPTDSDYQNKVNELIESAQKQMAERMQAKAAFHQELYQLLTPEQRNKLEQMKEKHTAMGKKGHESKHGSHKQMRPMQPQGADASES